MIQDNILRKLATNPTVFRQGNECFRQNDVKGLSTYKMPEQVQVTAYVQEQDMNKVEIALSHAMQSVLSFNCTCPQSKAYPGLCKHGIAVLMAYGARKDQDSIETTQKRDTLHSARSLSIESLLNQYKNIGRNNKSLRIQEEANIRLVPCFEVSQKGLIEMSLSIGQDKLHAVEDIIQLGQDIKDSRIKSYGRNSIFRHTIGGFEKNSQKLAEMIQGLNHQSITTDMEHDKSIITLNHQEFNQVFDMYKGKSMPLYGSETEQIQEMIWSEETPAFEFIIEEDNQQFKLGLKNIVVEQMRLLYQGEYMVYGDTLHLLSQDTKERIVPLLYAMLSEPDHVLTFNAEDLAKISRIILPALQQKVDMAISKESLEAYIPPELEAKFYLDMPKKSTLTAKVIYQYGEETYNAVLKEKAPSSIRDEYKEQVIEHLLWQYGFDQAVNGMYQLDQEALVYQFIKESMDALVHLGEVYISDKLKQARVRQVKAVSLGIRLEGDWLGIDLGALGIPKEELGRILSAYQAKKKYYRLKNGEFVDLTGEGLEQLESIAEGLNLTEQELSRQELLIPKYRALYLDKLLKEDKHIKPSRDAEFKTLVQDFEEIEDANITVPEALNGILREYQVTGYRWMKILGNYGFGGVLADDMGLGKTLQMIAVLSSEVSEAPSLIVCPTSLVFNWENEFEKFAPHMKVLLVQGSQAQREEKIKTIKDYDIIVTSYDSLKRDLEQYNAYTFNYCIIDEAQYIKNNQTQNAKAVKEVKSHRRMALTGTPIENSLAELWSIFDFVMPGYLLSDTQFRKKIEGPIIKDQDEEVMGRLKKMIAPFILRRLKKEVLEELPDKTESVIYSELSEEQHKVYMAYIAKARDELREQIQTEGIEKSHIKMLACLTRLRQICCHPTLFLENYTGESAKLQTCLELVRSTTESGHKILLFSQFTSMLDVLADSLKEEGISYSLLKGDVKAEKRRELVERFNTGDTQVFLISLKAGGVGLNLTSADVVIHYDPWWNASAENQATDRAYRIGQMNNVQVFKLITKGTIEEKIKTMQDQKQDLTDNILATEQTFINKLSQEDILDLFAIE